MEPVTHMLTGAVLARVGFNKRAAYATVAMAIAAELPDIDMGWSFAGPLTGFEHHRGITHTFVGIPFEALAVTAVCWGIYRLRGGKAAAPARWLLLYGGVLLALLSHILLDWTNNYGVRPFFPFDAHWYAGSFVFIFEPVLFLILLGALLLPPLFALINAEVGSRKRGFPSAGWSVTALVLVAGLYGYRWSEHETALREAAANTPGAMRVFASPHPINPWLWSTVAETADAYQLATFDNRTGLAQTVRPADTMYKPATSLALLAAKRSELGRVYLDWSMYPVLSESVDDSDAGHPLTRVTFEDARFMYNSMLGEGRSKPALGGSVLLDMQAPEGQRVQEIMVGGREQKE